MSALRRIARGVARNRMKQNGMIRFCKHDHVGLGWQIQRTDSLFSKNWKKTVKWRGIE